MSRARGVSSDLREVVEHVKAFCERKSIAFTHTEDMPFTQEVMVPSSEVLTITGYIEAVLEGRAVDMTVVPSESRLKPSALLFQDRIVEKRNTPPVAKTKKAINEGRVYKGKTIDESVTGIFNMVSNDILGVRDGMGFEPPSNNAVDTLNALRAGEIVSFIQYQLFSIIVPSLHMHGLEELFTEHEDAERVHSKNLAQRIHELGGSPIADLHAIADLSPYQVQDGNTAEQMVAILREQEEIAIEAYKKAIRELGQDDPVTRRLLEDILAEEEEHASDMQSMLEDV